MLAPFDREYRRMIETRVPSYPYTNRNEVFSLSTKYLLQDLLTSLVNSEVKIEEGRQKLNKLSRFSARLAFEKLDRLDKTYISETDVKYNLYVS